MRTRLPRSALLVSLLSIAACSSSSYQRVVSINPPDASLYINGDYVGKGDRRPREFDYSEVKCIYVQAVHPDYQPETQAFTEAQMRNLVDTNTDLKITLRSR